jgi:putative acetyltransferase
MPPLLESSIHIRDFRDGDEPALLAVFRSAIRMVASRDYTSEQIDAWAPRDLDPALWVARMQGIRPFVALIDDEIVGYGDLQTSGYVDHFFVSGQHPRMGIGTQLMTRIFDSAKERGITELTSDVSRTAQPFFERFGFVVVERRAPVIRGVTLQNALMRCDVTSVRAFDEV